MKTIHIFLGVLLSMLANLGMSQEFKKIDAEYTITSKTIIDPPAGEKKDRVLLFLEGRGAKELYKSIAVVEKKYACSDDMLVKSAGNFECLKNIKSGTYQCSIGILLNSGETVKGSVC